MADVDTTVYPGPRSDVPEPGILVGDREHGSITIIADTAERVVRMIADVGGHTTPTFAVSFDEWDRLTGLTRAG